MILILPPQHVPTIGTVAIHVHLRSDLCSPEEKSLNWITPHQTVDKPDDLVLVPNERPQNVRQEQGRIDVF